MSRKPTGRGDRARASAPAAEHVDFDVLIVGGGANGTGLARDLAKRGVRVLLCEKGDLARGATGNSSGMIHGGPRYLLNDVETTHHNGNTATRAKTMRMRCLIVSANLLFNSFFFMMSVLYFLRKILR